MKSVVSYRIKLASVSALGAVTLASALSLALALTLPQTRLPILAGFGVGAEARANHAAQRDMPAAEALKINRASLDAAPMNAAAWMRIAWLKTRNGSSLDAQGLDAIEKSYSVSPYGPDVSVWRMTFLFEHWEQLTPDIRKEVLAEQSVQPWRQTFDAATITNPSGRLAAQLNQVRAREALAVKEAAEKAAEANKS
jgi:hypothetical protein